MALITKEPPLNTESPAMPRAEVLLWLKEEDEETLRGLWDRADAERRHNVGDEVHLRGLVEISNHCARKCTYCGLAATHKDIERYRMDEDEILFAVQRAKDMGCGSVVLQSGEDYGIKVNWLSHVIRRIKEEAGIPVSLGLGERPVKDLHAWRQAGADRYFIRFGTSDPRLFERLHPSLPGMPSDRIALLGALKEMGYETSSGVVAGIPGQGYASLIDDLELQRALDLDMVSVGPYVTNPETPLGREEKMHRLLAGREQVPNTDLMTCKLIALTRITCPDVNIQFTAAHATMSPEEGLEHALTRGANVVVANLTPPEYGALFVPYPGKLTSQAPEDPFHGSLKERILSLGRKIGKGPTKRRRVPHAEAPAPG